MSATTEQQTLPQKAADAIIRLIQTENYAAGTKLPNEYELSRMLQVSRNTVREAIKLLVSRNILEVRRGAGTFVSNKHGLGDDPLGLSMITDQPRMIHEIMQICYLIEPRGAALAAQHASSEDIEHLQTLLAEQEILSNKKVFSNGSDIAFHLHIALCSQNTIIYNICHAFYNTFQQNKFIQQITLQMEGSDSLFINDHHKIFQAIQAHDACGAYDAMSAHLLHQMDYLQKQPEYTDVFSPEKK